MQFHVTFRSTAIQTCLLVRDSYLVAKHNEYHNRLPSSITNSKLLILLSELKMPSKVHRNVDLGTEKKEREKEVKSLGPDSYLRFAPADCGVLLQVTW